MERSCRAWRRHGPCSDLVGFAGGLVAVVGRGRSGPTFRFAGLVVVVGRGRSRPTSRFHRTVSVVFSVGLTVVVRNGRGGPIVDLGPARLLTNGFGLAVVVRYGSDVSFTGSLSVGGLRAVRAVDKGSNIYEQLTRDPTSSYTRKVRDALKSIETKGNMSRRQYLQFTPLTQYHRCSMAYLRYINQMSPCDR